VLYTSQHESLAVLEVLANTPVASLPDDMMSITLELPDVEMKTVEKDLLPVNWHHFPSPDSLKKMGDTWAAELDALALLVPSVIIHNEWNVLINPKHPEAGQIKLRDLKPFHFDKRLVS
jgi:RES domain-containing protein